MLRFHGFVAGPAGFKGSNFHRHMDLTVWFRKKSNGIGLVADEDDCVHLKEGDMNFIEIAIVQSKGAYKH